MVGLDFLASIGGNAMNGLVNEYFQKRAADYNLELADKAAANEYNRQLDFWHKQNAYNDPRRQVARMVSAGLSPVDNVDSGNSQGLSSVPGNDFAKGGAIEAPQLDLIDAAQTFANIRKIGKDGDLVDQQVANLIADQYLKSIDGELRSLGLDELAEKIEGLKLDNVLKGYDVGLRGQDFRRGQLADQYQYDSEYYKALKAAAIQTAFKVAAEAESLDFDNFRKEWANEFQLQYGVPEDIAREWAKVLMDGLSTVSDILPSLGKTAKGLKNLFNKNKK